MARMTGYTSEFRSSCSPVCLSVSLSSDSKAWNSRATSDPTKPTCEIPSSNPPHTLSRKQWRNRQKNKRRQKNKFRLSQPPEQAPAPAPASAEEAEVPSAPSPDSHGTRAEALRARMAQRLDGARFRYLNEQLYSGPSSAAQRLFHKKRIFR